jgi:hypothetical protein
LPWEHFHQCSLCAPALEILDEVHQSYPEDSPKDYCDPGRKSWMRCSSYIQWTHRKTTVTLEKCT